MARPEEYIVRYRSQGLNEGQLARSIQDTSSLEVILMVPRFAVSWSDDVCLFVCRDQLK